MPTPLEVLDGAAWLCDVFPNTSDIYYTSDGWRVRTGKNYVTHQGMLDCVLRRDVSATQTLGCVGGISLLPDDPVKAGWTQFSRIFLQHNRRNKWTDGAAWAVLQASEIEYVAPDAAQVFMDHMWWCRSDFGDCMISSQIETRYHAGFRTSLDVAKNQTLISYPAITSWIPRAFLEAWPNEKLPTTTVPVVSAPAVDVKVNLSVTTEEQLPPDLRGKVQLKGATAQERRQVHTKSILQDMLTRTSPPRYK